ncbi:MAG: hypothetical protein IIB38_16400 [Candidatus Hydrogenedentes bacterium]|nr:hypothetical protein [Candidatus Hydrogenedentota bacterium]
MIVALSLHDTASGCVVRQDDGQGWLSAGDAGPEGPVGDLIEETNRRSA